MTDEIVGPTRRASLALSAAFPISIAPLRVPAAADDTVAAGQPIVATDQNEDVPPDFSRPDAARVAPHRIWSIAVPASRLSVRDVSRSFSLHGRSLEVLSGIDLDVEDGSFLTIVGASGCGKSTLLKVIAGLLAADGHPEHHGRPVTGPSLDRGIVFQEPRLFPWLTVEQNVALGLENARLDRGAEERLVREHLLLVGLSRFAKAYPGQLSGGMAQRAASARGLANRPSVLLMDEPFGALDALTRARLQDEPQGIWAQERTTALFVTHDVDEAVLLGDRVVIMAPHPGRIAKILGALVLRPRARRSSDLIDLRNGIVDVLEATAGASAPEPPAQPVQRPRTEPLVLPA